MTPTLVDEILTRLVSSDRNLLRHYCLELVRQGLSINQLVCDGLAPAMSEVGLLWECGAWSVADEHLATNATENVLAVVSAEAALAAVGRRQGENSNSRSVIVACVEGDWHGLASRMVAEVLADGGWDVKFFGASQPTNDLVVYVRRHQPKAVLLTCSMPSALPAMAKAVQGIRELNIPVYVGGRALGIDHSRADAIGADGWALDATGASDLLLTNQVAGPSGDIELRLELYEKRAATLGSWVDSAAMDFPDGIRDSPFESWILQLLDIACIALLIQDEKLLLEETRWLHGVLLLNGMPEITLSKVLSAYLANSPLIEDGDLPQICELLVGVQNSLLNESANSSHH